MYGMRFGNYRKRELNDGRKIYITFFRSNGDIEYYTSDDQLSVPMMMQIERALIIDVSLIDEEWHVVIGDPQMRKVF